MSASAVATCGLQLAKGAPVLCLLLTYRYLPPATKLGQGNVFTGVCDSVKGGCYPRMHCRWYPSMPCSRSAGGGGGGCLVLGGSAPRGSSCSRGCLLPGGMWPSVMAFCCGLLLCPSVMAFWFGGLLIEKAWPWGGRRPPHQKATTPEGHNSGLVETPSTPQRLLLRAVRILLECILVLLNNQKRI